jgi:hypothetical protein
MGPSEVTLQINVAPTDFPHARYTLAHQLGVWGGQVQEILFTYDLHRTERGGRFGEGWQERRGPMEELLASLCARHPHARVAEVDYSPAAAAAVAETFTGGRPVPPKDTKGAPYYPYFAGLHEARFDLIVHMDSDVMFGGASQTWVGEGCELLARDAAVLACGPLPGPPASDGRLRRQSGETYPLDSPAYSFDSLSSRIFMIDRSRLVERVCPIPLLGPVRPVAAAKARLHGNPPYRAAELAIGDAMVAAGMRRVDFLGRDPGIWSVHPPYRSDEFYAALPAIIAQIEAGTVSDDQLGDYELSDGMFDWTAARRRARLRRLWA